MLFKRIKSLTKTEEDPALKKPLRSFGGRVLRSVAKYTIAAFVSIQMGIGAAYVTGLAVYSAGMATADAALVIADNGQALQNWARHKTGSAAASVAGVMGFEVIGRETQADLDILRESKTVDDILKHSVRGKR